MKNIYLKKEGFTLIELLVVIAIIALLLSVIMPALKKAKEQAMSMTCMSNQRQASIAALTYSSENNEFNIPSWQHMAFLTNLTPEHWYTFLKPYYDDTKAMLLCPRAKKPYVDISNPDSIWGTATSAYFPDPRIHTENELDHYGGFGYNNWLEYDSGDQDKAILKRDSVKQPGEVPVFGDCTWADAGWVAETDTIPIPEDRYDPHYAPDAGWLKRFCLDRHQDAINVACMDGRVEYKVDVDDLLKYRWHGRWDKSLIIQ
jgi:prepilin-type N-terminal cleavage/methylation domain-containing protein